MMTTSRCQTSRWSSVQASELVVDNFTATISLLLPQNVQPPPPEDDLITVSDILLVMDQAGGGQLTAAMLEVRPSATPIGVTS